jgi:hypothetical protein
VEGIVFDLLKDVEDVRQVAENVLLPLFAGTNQQKVLE